VGLKNYSTNIWEPGWLYNYVADADRIAECPLAKRHKVTNNPSPNQPSSATPAASTLTTPSPRA
jgi:hypothetical protein